MPPVVLQKTITIFAIVTQIYFAIIAVPKCVVSHSCGDCNSDTDAVYLNLEPESESCRSVWVVVLLVMADQDAFGSSSYQSNSSPAVCGRSFGL